jgi:predicted RNase H-like HicB family nuclease
MMAFYSIRLNLEPNPGGVYTVTSPDVPGLVTEGSTPEEIRHNVQEALDVLLAAGLCEEGRQAKGSHRYWLNPETNQVTTIPDWGSRDLASGTVRAIIRQLGISRKDFGPIK